MLLLLGVLQCRNVALQLQIMYYWMASCPLPGFGKEWGQKNRYTVEGFNYLFHRILVKQCQLLFKTGLFNSWAMFQWYIFMIIVQAS